MHLHRQNPQPQGDQRTRRSTIPLMIKEVLLEKGLEILVLAPPLPPVLLPFPPVLLRETVDWHARSERLGC